MATVTAEPRRERPGVDYPTTLIACEGCGLGVRPRDAERTTLAGGLVVYLCPACVEAVRGKG